MTNHSRRQQPAAAPETTVEQQLQRGYLEVQMSGLTLRRLAITYLLLARNACLHTTDGFRALRRPTPAH